MTINACNNSSAKPTGFPRPQPVREQQARLLPLLAEGNSFVTGALTRIKQTYLARDWKNYFQFGWRLMN